MAECRPRAAVPPTNLIRPHSPLFSLCFFLTDDRRWLVRSRRSEEKKVVAKLQGKKALAKIGNPKFK